MTIRTCRNCSRRVAYAEDAEQVFCVWCGTSVTKSRSPQRGQNPSPPAPANPFLDIDVDNEREKEIPRSRYAAHRKSEIWPGFLAIAAFMSVMWLGLVFRLGSGPHWSGSPEGYESYKRASEAHEKFGRTLRRLGTSSREVFDYLGIFSLFVSLVLVTGSGIAWKKQKALAKILTVASGVMFLPCTFGIMFSLMGIFVTCVIVVIGWNAGLFKESRHSA